MFDKGLVSRKCKELSKFNSQNKKFIKRVEVEVFLQRRDTAGKQVCEKMFDNIGHWGSINKNDSEISLYTVTTTKIKNWQ